MSKFRAAWMTLALFGMAGGVFGQSLKEELDGLEKAAKEWMANASTGARVELLASTIPEFIATTPAGDVVVRENIIPSQTDAPVQRLPSAALEFALPLLLGDTGVVMARFKPVTGPGLNATFVFVRREASWKLAAVHFSRVGY
jgi:hypothetical protein